MKLTGSAFVPSLQHIASTRVSVILWNQPHIKSLLAKHIASPGLSKDPVLTSEWQMIKTNVIEMAQQLPGPNFLREEISRFVRAVGWRIVMWFSFHEKLYDNHSRLTELIDMFHWTPHGTIDHKKTAEILVQDECLPVAKRYALACLYCLEDHISSLSGMVGFKFLDDSITKLNITDNQYLISLWSDYLQGNFPSPCHHTYPHNQLTGITFGNYGLQVATRIGNVAAMKYFCDKIPEEQKALDLVAIARRVTRTDFIAGTQVFHADAMAFLISAMDEKEQMRLTKRCLYGVLSAFLVWPWQECFIEVVERFRCKFSHECYYVLLDLIIDTAAVGHGDYDYLKLFINYWHKISIECRRYYVREAIEEDNFMKLLDSDNQQVITLVLADASAPQKEMIIFGSETQNVCLTLILLNKWNMLEFFFVECLRNMGEVTSKIVQLKRDFKYYEQKFGGANTPVACQLIWHKFFGLLDEYIDQNNKGIEEEGTAIKRCRQT